MRVTFKAAEAPSSYTPQKAAAYKQANAFASYVQDLCQDTIALDNGPSDLNPARGKVYVPRTWDVGGKGPLNAGLDFDPATGKVNDFLLTCSAWKIEVNTTRGCLGLGEERTTTQRTDYHYNRHTSVSQFADGDRTYVDRWKWVS